MAKKVTSRMDEYREIIERSGIEWENCEVLAFVFDDDNKVYWYYLNLMNNRAKYYLFSCVERTAVIVAPKGDDGNLSDIMLYAEQNGGKPRNKDFLK